MRCSASMARPAACIAAVRAAVLPGAAEGENPGRRLIGFTALGWPPRAHGRFPLLARPHLVIEGRLRGPWRRPRPGAVVTWALRHWLEFQEAAGTGRKTGAGHRLCRRAASPRRALGAGGWDGARFLRAGARPAGNAGGGGRGVALAGFCNRATASIQAASPTGVDRLQSPTAIGSAGEDLEALCASVPWLKTLLGGPCGAERQPELTRRLRMKRAADSGTTGNIRLPAVEVDIR